jgi:hypothetical protein
MSEDTRVGTPAPAWLYDDETGQTRWWNGAGWTDHARPLDPVVRTWTEHRPAGTSPAYAQPAPKSTRAKAWFAVLLIAVVGIGLVVLGFLAFRLATAPGAVDSAALEGEIAAWANGETGEISLVTCPDAMPDATGAVFLCSVVDGSGVAWDVAVTVHADSVTWEAAP